MNNINPSWSQWKLGDTPEIERSEQEEPPVQNKNEAQNDEVADVKSATDSYEKLDDVDTTTLRKEMYNYEEQLIEEDLDKVIKNLQRKTPTKLIDTDDEFKLDLNKFDNDNDTYKVVNVASSATKTRELKRVPIERLQSNRRQAKNNLEQRDWKINTQQAQSEFSFEALQNRKLSSNLALLFSRIAEERTGDKIAGRHKWDIEKIMFRRVSKKLITQCKYSRDKEKIIILLDSSPSCSRMANLYSQISTEACKYDHVELYDAPNGYIHSKYSISEKKYVPLTDEQLDNVYYWLGFEGRTIIYFGDEDATSSMYKAYKYSEIHWFYQNPSSHQNKIQRQYTLERLHEEWDDKLKIYECSNVNEIVKAVKEMK